MATLKDHQQAMVDLMAHGSAIPASAMRLAHAMHDVLKALTSDVAVMAWEEQVRIKQLNDATTPGLNDAALAGDPEAVRPKVKSAERRVKELENTCKQLRANNAKLTEERDYWIRTCRGTEQNLIRTRQELETTKALPEQAGCRKPDTQVFAHSCEHAWTKDGWSPCTLCGAIKL